MNSFLSDWELGIQVDSQFLLHSQTDWAGLRLSNLIFGHTYIVPFIFREAVQYVQAYEAPLMANVEAMTCITQNYYIKILATIGPCSMESN